MARWWGMTGGRKARPDPATAFTCWSECRRTNRQRCHCTIIMPRPDRSRKRSGEAVTTDGVTQCRHTHLVWSKPQGSAASREVERLARISRSSHRATLSRLEQISTSLAGWAFS